MIDGDIENRVVQTLPWVLQLAYSMQKNGIRGGYFLEAVARSKGWLNVLVRRELSRGVKVDIPAYEDSYDLDDVSNYERELIELLGSHLSGKDEPLLLLDCGADLGLFAALLVSSCERIQKVIAFEPNRRSFRLLEHNLNMLPMEAEARNAAVADFNGKGKLKYPPHDLHDHAAFIVSSECGDIPVVKLDDLGLPRNYHIVLKIDVEGGELAVIRGAMETLSSSPGFTVVFEAHRDQVRRTGIEPMEIVSLLQTIRPCQIKVAEEPDIRLDMSRPFFEQLQGRIYNICAFSS